MSYAAWLFLYVAGLIDLALRYRLSLHSGFTVLIILLPLLLLAARLPRTRALRIAGTALALVCAIAFARATSLDFWNPDRIDLALLSAGVGIGGLLAMTERADSATWPALEWLLIGVSWLFGLWHPFAPWLAIAPVAALGLWRSAEPATEHRSGLSPAWMLFWIGMALSKPWWDAEALGTVATALWAMGVCVSYAPALRNLRLPQPLWCLALVPLLYPWLPIWLWAPLSGLLSGHALQRAARPWHWAGAYALLLGVMLSYGLHSNLQWFGWLVWGSR